MKKYSSDDLLPFLGQRVDKFLSGQFPDLSRAKIQEKIKDANILVNSKQIKPSYTLSVGDDLYIDSLDVIEPSLLPEAIDIDILHETPDYFVINKAAGMVVHPTESGHHFNGTVVNAVMDKINLEEFEDKLRPGIVHRLDKDTSGVLIIAKNLEAYKYFVSQFKGRKVEKHYKVLVSGVLDYNEGIIDSPMSRDPINRKRMAVVSGRDGKEAITIYKVDEEFEIHDTLSVSLLDVEIKTGRTHQIRVHMSAIGHPVVCDAIYGNRKVNTYFKEKYALKRHFLHAYSLSFDDFRSGKRVNIKSDLPEDLINVTNSLV
jgi:23S rRNA pseudouridine1911/1915/1917 synthase